MGNMVKQNNDVTLVFSGRVARALLRKGYEIVDIKANKQDTDKTVFIFKTERDIANELSAMTKSESVEL